MFAVIMRGPLLNIYNPMLGMLIGTRVCWLPSAATAA
jgi:hypothetical protein